MLIAFGFIRQFALQLGKQCFIDEVPRRHSTSPVASPTHTACKHLCHGKIPQRDTGNYQAAGLVNVPCASVSVGGNCAAFRTPARICLMKSICGSSARLGFGCGFSIPTFLPRCWRTILIGSRRSESFETTTATSN